MGKDLSHRNDILARSRDILSRISEMTSVAFWMVTPNYRKILYLSPAFERILGREISEVYANPRLWFESIHPEDRQHAQEIKTKSHDARYEMERRIIRPDGTMIWVLDHAFPVKDERDDVSYVIGFVEEITDRKNIEIGLLESEKRYRTLVETSTDGIAVIQDDGIVFTNDRLIEKTGFTREELSSVPFYQFIHPDDYDMVVNRYAGRMNGAAASGPLEFRVLTKNKKVVYTEINAALTHWEGKAAVLCFFRDITDRKATQEALEKSEERYRDLVEEIEDIIYVMDEKGKFLFANNALLKFAGLDRNKIHTIHFVEMITPESYRYVKDIYRRQLNGEDVGAFEINFQNKKGDILSIETRERLIWKEGRVTEVHGIGRDITERKKAEEALITQQQELNNIFEFTGTAMIIVEDDMTVTKCNHEFEQLVGRTKEDIEGKMKWTTFVHPEELDRMVEYYRARRFGDRAAPPHYESRSIDRNGIIRNIYLTIGLLPGTKRTAAAILDITDRKRSENALRESEEKLRNLFDTSKDVIFLSTITGWFYDINLAGEEFFGYSRDELLRLDIQDIYKSEGDRQILHETIEKYGFVKDWEVTLKKKDGGYVDCLITATLRKDREGNTIGYQGIIRDIGERKRMEEQLAAAKKMEAVGTLAGGIAHNFNNILVGIMGYSEFLLGKKDPGDPDYKALSIIHEGTVSASKLTKELLSIARGGGYNLVRLNLNNVIEKFLPLIAGTLDKSINIKTYLSDDLPAVLGDISQIQQCLLNLCINARDAMPGGGDLTIETYRQFVGEDVVKAHLGARVGDYSVVSVTDSGEGISEEHKPHIFEPFFTTKGHTLGTGLGLSTVWGIMKSHKGLITVYSEPSEGTAFKLYFPAATAQPDKSPHFNKGGVASGVGTILLIDDEPIVREMWGNALSERGFRVIIAEDGIQGIDIFQREKDTVDLVIIDYIMPRMGGAETLHKLKELNADVKVLVSSGYGQNSKVWDSIGDQADGFIQKPCQISRLIEKVDELIKKP
jgi:PAS domain S-box-containing protein